MKKPEPVPEVKAPCKTCNDKGIHLPKRGKPEYCTDCNIASGMSASTNLNGYYCN